MDYLFVSVVLLILCCVAARRNPRYRSTLIVVNLLVCLIYVIWRVTAIPRGSWWSFAAGALLFAAELLGIFEFLTLQLLFTKRRRLPQATLDAFGGSPPTVDLFICTYNEPLSLLETTILAARNLRYDPDKLRVHVCDDGRREALQQLSAALGVNYITRDTNQGAKAGNLNNALAHTGGEFFAVLDADMICTRDFLQRTLGYFADPNTAFVQTPQVYYNQDMYQRNLNGEIPNEQDFFMRDVQEGRAAVDAVLHVGTNAVFRRSYVEQVGGYPTTSITEDMALGLALQEKGYRTEFVNEVLVLGLSASTYTDLAKQRDRWCRGNLQVIRQFKPFSRRGLSRLQKLAYLDGTLYWFTCFQKMIFVLSPIYYLLTSQVVLHASIEEILIHFVPFFVGQILVFQVIAPHTRSLRWAHIYELAMAPHMCMAILKELFSLKVQFAVTPKEGRGDRSFFQLRVILPHLLLGLLTLLSWLTGALLFHYGVIEEGAMLLNLIWSGYNLVGIFICLQAAHHRANAGRAEGVRVEGGYLTSCATRQRVMRATVVRLFRDGMAVSFEPGVPPAPGERLEITVQWEGKRHPVACQVECVERETARLRYLDLELNHKRAIVGMFTEHLRPAYPLPARSPHLEVAK